MHDMIENEITQPISTPVPEMKFIENIDDFMKLPTNDSADIVLKNLEEMINKYKYFEEGLLQRKLRLKSQIPDLEQSLELLNTLEDKQASSDAFATTFMLSDQCYVQATVPPTKTVGLWLGANVMLEYSLEEARELLSRNLQSAHNGITSIAKDLDFIRDQITTTEVNMARVYNWDVQRRKNLNASS